MSYPQIPEHLLKRAQAAREKAAAYSQSPPPARHHKESNPDTVVANNSSIKPATPPITREIAQKSINELGEEVKTCVRLTKKYLKRLDDLDKNGYTTSHIHSDLMNALTAVATAGSFLYQLMEDSLQTIEDFDD